jgi:N,N'-diacetyllegionaminate synthase
LPPSHSTVEIMTTGRRRDSFMHDKDSNRPTVTSTNVIAEMACSHEGDSTLARTIIDGAGQAGADGIQFQIWRLENTVVPQHRDYQRIARLEMSQAVWGDLAAYVRQRFPNMQIIACVQDHSSIDFCESIQVDAYKLHSSDLSNPPIVKHVAKTGRRIDLSVGGSTIDEIQRTLEWIREVGDAKIWLMYGYQRFPTPTDAIHLNYMQKLAELFELPIGYQDHSAGGSDAAFWLPAAAMGMGVDAVEIHVTHDRSKKGIDHEAAMNPDEFARFVAMVREIDRAKGIGVPRPFSPEESAYRKYSKKSLVAACPIAAGKRLVEEHWVALRTEELGLPPDQANRIIGRTAKREIAAYQLIREEDLQ